MNEQLLNLASQSSRSQLPNNVANYFDKDMAQIGGGPVFDLEKSLRAGTENAQVDRVAHIRRSGENGFEIFKISLVRMMFW